MAVRTSMDDLLTRVRDLIQDPAAQAAPQFTDQQLQDALDFKRQEMRYVPLQPAATYQPGSVIVYLDYYSDSPNWESDVVLTDLSYNVLTPAASEYIVGHWSFASQPNGIAVRATGKTYDLYGAAADLCEKWAGALKLGYHFESDMSRFHLEMQMANLLAMAKTYRQQATIQITKIVQRDAMPDHDSAGIVYPAPSTGYW